MIRGVMEMLPLMSDSERSSGTDGGDEAVFRLPDADSVTLDGSTGDPMGDDILEGVGARSEQETPTDETREDVSMDDSGAEQNDEAISADSNDEGELRATSSREGDEVRKSEGSTGHKDDTVEAQMAARMDLVDRMARASERLAGKGKKGRVSAADLLAAGRKKVLDLDALATRRLQGRKGKSLDLAGMQVKGDAFAQQRMDRTGAESASEALDQARLLRDGAKNAMDNSGRRVDVDAGDELANLRQTRQEGASEVKLSGRVGEDAMALRAGDMARRAARAQARHLRQEISSTEALRATSSTAAPEATARTEAPDAAKANLATHVAREVKKAVNEMDKGKSKVAVDEAKITSLQSPQLTDGGASTAQMRTPTVQLGPAQPVETFNLDPKVSEALRSLHQSEESQTVLRLNNGNAGKIEVRLRMDGRDLTVQMKADDVEGRQKMLEALPELRRELDKAQLVAGRVDITEFGHAEFDLNSEDQTFDQEDAEDKGSDGSADQKGPAAGRSGGSANAGISSGAQTRDDGRLHVVV